jgi:proline iminopeptidase
MLVVGLLACQGAQLVPATVAEDDTLPAWEHDQVLFHLERRGDETAPVLIFLHGGPGDDYRYMLPLAEQPVLADSYEIVLWDQRGTGLSERLPGVTLADYLSDLEALVDTAGSRPVVLVGHSWGGMYAAMYAQAHPERLSGLVLLEPGELSTELGELQPDSELSLKLTAEWLNDWMWGRQLLSMGDHERADFFLAQGLLSDLQPQRNDELGLSWRLGAAVKLGLYLGELQEPFDFTTRLDEVQPEVLLVAGSRTEDLGTAFQEEQAQVFREARVETVEGAGHSDLTGSHAAQTAVLVEDYLQRVGVRP